MTNLKINEVYVFVAQDEDGEGIFAHSTYFNGDHVFMPFVCADKERMQSLKPFAKKVSKEHNKKIKIVKFSVREDVEEI